MAEPVLEFEDVTVSFDGEAALNQVSLRVERGQTWVILGAAGSGKTVLLKTAIGLLRPDRGRVRLFGQDITGMSERDLFRVRSQVGMLFQESALFDSLTIADNVAYPLRNQPVKHCEAAEIDRKVADALRFVELEQTQQKFPNELSGGMRRRVGIARATVTNPPLAIYDSPTAGLDPITANNIMAFIAKQRDLRRTTTILVTYRYQDGILMANYRYEPESARLIRSANGRSPAACTIFLVLEAGRIAFQGSQQDLEASTNDYVSKFGKR